MVDREFDLPTARAQWRRMNRNGIVVGVMGAGGFLLGAALVGVFGHEAIPLRSEIVGMFVAAAGFIAAFVWTPLRPTWRTRRSPTRLVLDSRGLRLELESGPAETLRWDFRAFHVSLMDWGYPIMGTTPTTFELGPYSAVPLEPAAFGALRAELEARGFRAVETVWKLRFPTRLARRWEYTRSAFPIPN